MFWLRSEYYPPITILSDGKQQLINFALVLWMSNVKHHLHHGAHGINPQRRCVSLSLSAHFLCVLWMCCFGFIISICCLRHAHLVLTLAHKRFHVFSIIYTYKCYFFLLFCIDIRCKENVYSAFGCWFPLRTVVHHYSRVQPTNLIWFFSTFRVCVCLCMCCSFSIEFFIRINFKMNSKLHDLMIKKTQISYWRSVCLFESCICCCVCWLFVIWLSFFSFIWRRRRQLCTVHKFIICVCAVNCAHNI